MFCGAEDRRGNRVIYAFYKECIEQRGVHDQLGPVGQGWGIEQNPHELATFVIAMQELGVQSVLEIGTGYKAGLAQFIHYDLGWQVVSVDIRDYGHAFEGITFIIGQYEADRQFDLVFIDGEHTYEAVRHDLADYGAYATRAWAFHDIAGLRDCGGVAQYWRDIAYTKAGKLRKGFHEVIDDSERRAGIGWRAL